MTNRFAALLKGATVSAVLLIGLIWLDGLMESQAAAAREEIFQANSDRAADIIAERTQRVVERLDDVSIVIENAGEAGVSVTQSFHDYAYEANIFAEHPEMVAIGHFAVMTEETRAAVTQGFSADPWRDQIGLPRMDIRPPGARDLHIVMATVFPIDLLPNGVGFDIYTTPRRPTLDRAMELRRPQVTPRLELLTGDQGVVIFAPIFVGNDDALPAGFVSTAFATDVFLQQNASLLAPLELDLELHDIGPADSPSAAPELETLLTSTIPGFASGQLDEATLLINDPTTTVRDIQVAGRVWRIVSRPKAELGPTLESEVTYSSILGVAVAILIGAIVWRDQEQAIRLEDEVSRKTKDLREAAKVVEEERAAALFLASHDKLTGLLNRRGFEDVLNELIGGCSDPLREVSLMAIDLDGFKGVNDTLGHQGGDDLLQRVAVFLRETAPEGSVICRLGGDEFLACMPDTSDDDVEGFASLLISWTGEPQVVAGTRVKFGMSIGVARGRLQNLNTDRIVGDADLALYQAKGSGKGQVCFFDKSLRERTQSRRAIAEDLQRAFENDEFVPYFQTQHDSHTHQIIGVEALVRWIKPDLSIVPPGEFLPAVENIGRMQDLDLHIMQRANETIRELEADGLSIPKLSVNVSLPRLRAPGFVESVQALPKTGAKLHLEILETVFLDDGPDTRDWAIDILRESGIGLEVDDFGSGHASVIGLTQLAPDVLKIDRALIFPMLESPERQTIIKAIAEIGAALGIRVTAEGVESMAHAQMLRDIGIDSLQGFAFSRPMPAADLRQMLLRQAA